MTPITIIFNPHSTGSGAGNAKVFGALMADEFDVTLRATEYAGHAEKIAAEITEQGKEHIIVCSSGDGTYNEVINGVMHLPHEHIRTAIIPSGNANDHYHALSNGQPLAQRIRKHDFEKIDILKLETENLVRYAHSYIGFGLTPHIGEKLTEAKLTKWNEGWIVFKNLFTVKPVKIIQGDHKEKYDNLVFANVNKMSKVLKLSNVSSITDGKFEIIRHKSVTIGTLIGYLFRASTLGLHTSEHDSKRQFSLDKKTQVQLDGEVLDLDKNSEITVEIVPRTLWCTA